MHRRVLYAPTILVVGGIALAGCSGPVRTSDDGSGTLTVSATAAYQPGLDTAIASFEEAYPDVDVEVEYMGEDGASVLRTQLASGTAADVMYVQPGNGTVVAIQNLVPAGLLADLSDYEFSADVPEVFDATTQVDGKRYFIPMGYDGIAALYNQEAFNELGIEEPTTWTELLQMCDAATAVGKYAFAYGGQSPWVNLQVPYTLAATLVYESNPDFEADVAAGKTSFAESEWRTALEKLIEMQERGCFSPDPLGTDFAASMTAVGTGEAVAAIQVTVTLPMFKAASAAGTLWGSFPVPATDEADSTWIPVALNGGYAVNATAENPVAATLFINHLADPAVYLEYVNAQGSFPALPVEGFAVPAEFDYLPEFLDAGRTYPWMDQLWPNPQVQPPLIEGTQALLGGVGSIADMLEQMDAAYAEDPSAG